MVASPLRDDLVSDWLEELQHVSVADLSPTALAAVIEVIDSFAAEDGVLPRSALRMRVLLAARADSPLPDRDSRLGERVRSRTPRQLARSVA